MRKITEVLRLRFELGLGQRQRQIARSCSIGVGTVHEYLVRARKAGLTWPLPAAWGEEQVQAALFGSGPARAGKVERVAPDFAGIDEQRRKHKHVTLRLLWEEYLEANPDGYRYSRFCYHYQRWRGVQDVVLRQEHKAGEKIFADWAGVKIPIYSRTDAEVRQAHLFVAVLGASSYTFAEATLNEQMIHWLGAHIHTFEFFGGTPKLIIP